MRIKITHSDGATETWDIPYHDNECLAGIWLPNHAAWWQIGGNIQDLAADDACWELQHD